MAPRTTSTLRCAALCLLVVASSPAARAESDPSNDRTLSPQAVCTIGVLPPFGSPVAGVLTPPEDTYYTLLLPADCSACPNGYLLSRQVRISLHFPDPCTLTARVSIIAASGTPSCPAPGPGPLLCPPALHSLVALVPGSADIVLPLPMECCLLEPAFLVVTFTSAGTCGTLPRLWLDDGCNACVSYRERSGLPLHDLCSTGLPGNPMMSLEADCCEVVPTRPSTWGRVKTLYR
jgi:hypothetical protein